MEHVEIITVTSDVLDEMVDKILFFSTQPDMAEHVQAWMGGHGLTPDDDRVPGEYRACALVGDTLMYLQTIPEGEFPFAISPDGSVQKYRCPRS
ncbi:MAG: hypothetical protein IPM45_11335 [Acidimicrobiales bacterium]|nr:hypothetical protein [Acidimicrobiales bacterium]